ncbi:hypothetical protein J5690_05920 [bacterium]|nr:hypothetical protein [bacterium]
MADFLNKSWIVCEEPENLGLMEGTKVHLSQCISCKRVFCTVKQQLFTAFFPEWVELRESPLNMKIVELNKSLAKRKKLAHFYCPKKKQASKDCNAHSYFCKYNLICGVFGEREGKNFIKSLRWRKEMVYFVMYLDGTTEVVGKNDLGNVDIDKVERVYPGNYEVRIVSELVPQGEEREKLGETIASFKEKYSGSVVSGDGLVDFESWFENASNGDSAIIPEKVLVPQKTYKVVKIKDVVEPSGIKVEKTDGPETAPEEKTQPEAETKPEPKKEKAKSAKTEDDAQGSLFDDTKNLPAETAAEEPKKRGRKKKVVE